MAKNENVNIKVESEKFDPNKGDDKKFKSHKYFSNKEREFWKTVKKIYRKYIL